MVTPADFDAWARVKSAVVPDEPVTGDQMVARHEEGRLLLLAELGGRLVGCGGATRSHFAGREQTAALPFAASSRFWT